MCILSLYIFYNGVTIMGLTNHDISTINMYSSQKIVILHHYLPITAISPQRPLSSVPKVAFVERFDWIFAVLPGYISLNC